MTQISAPDMMLLDQVKAPDKMPAFESYNRSPVTIPDDFVEWLFSGQELPSDSSPMGQTGQQGYEKLVSISHIL
jgi:hypothetical protein